MNRISLRRILPIVQLVLAVSLYFLSDAQENARFADIGLHSEIKTNMRLLKGEISLESLAKKPSGVGWDLRTMISHEPPVPAASLLIGINFPISLPLGIAAVGLMSPDTPAWASYVFSVLGLVAFLAFWYTIGRKLDRWFGLGDENNSELLKLPPIPMRGITTVMFYALLVVVSYLLIFVLLGRPNTHFMNYSLLGWVWGVVFLREFRDWLRKRAIARQR